MELYGYHPPSITSSLRESSMFQPVQDHMKHQKQFFQLLKEKLNLAQNRMKQQADQHHNEQSFNVGDC